MNLTTVPATRLLGVVGIALLLGLGWLALIGPATGAISETGDARLEAQDRAHGMGVQLAQLRRQAAELPETDAQAQRLNEMWPATADQPGFFLQVADAATDAGIDLDDITVLSPSVPQRLDIDPNAAATVDDGAGDGAVAEVGVSDIAVQAVTIGAEGTYTELSTLLAKLEKMPRSFLVGSVTLDADTSSADDTGTDVLSLTVVGQTFVAPPLDPPPAS